MFDRLLTPRQAEAVRLLGCGWTPKQIAQAMCVDTRTVYCHLTEARGKLHAGSLLDLAVKVATAEAGRRTQE